MKKIIIMCLILVMSFQLIGCQNSKKETQGSTQKNEGLSSIFDKQKEVFGIFLYATKDVDDKKLQHATNVLARYLDNNEDGIVDNQLVLDKMLEKKASMIIFKSPESAEKFMSDHTTTLTSKLRGSNATVKEDGTVEIQTPILKVTNEDAAKFAKNIAKEEGIFVGISSGANLYAANEVSKRYKDQNKTIVTVLCDTGERYLSTPLFDD